MTKKRFLIAGLILLPCLVFAILYYKKGGIKDRKTPPYISLVGPVHMMDGIGRQTAELADLLCRNFTVNVISDNVNPSGVPPRVLDLVKKKSGLFGKIVIYEDCVWKPDNEASKYLKTIKNNKQIRIAYSMLEFTRIPQEWVMQLNLYFDAVVVPDPFLVNVYKQSGVKIPVFVIPLGVDLQEFLQKPLKAKPNAVFTFANFGTAIDRKNQITLIRAFARAFGDNPNVILHINSRGGDEKVRKEIIDEVVKQKHSNVFFTELKLKKDAYVAFFQTVDCYVSPSKGEGFSIQPREAMALGIPVIASDNTAQKTLCSSHLVQAVRSEIAEPGCYFGGQLPIGCQFNCEEEELAQAMLDVYKNYEIHLERGQKAREWAASYDYTNASLQSLYKSLVSPKRVVLGPRDEIHPDYFMTNSQELYRKYSRLVKKRPDPAAPYPSANPTPVLKALKSIDISPCRSGLNGIDCIYVINLDERPNRWKHASHCFAQEGLLPNRVSAINGWKIPMEQRIQLMDGPAILLDGGALGCLLTHVSIYKDALERGFQTAWICEDDIEFAERAEKIPGLLDKLTALDPDWDVLYTDYCTTGVGVQNVRPGQIPYENQNREVSDDLVRMHGRYNTHSMIFSRKGLAKVFDYFTHVYLWTPIDKDIHYVPGLREYSVKKDVVTTINDSSMLATDGSSDTQPVSSLNCNYN